MIRPVYALLGAGIALLTASAWAQQPPQKPAAPAPAPAEPAPKPTPAETEAAEEEPDEDATPSPPPKPAPAPPTRPAPAQPGFTPMPMLPQPGADAQALERQGAARPETKTDGSVGDDRVYAEDWWSHARPMLELHGYFRVRAELFHNFSLGRVDERNRAMWPMPIDNHYVGRNSAVFGPALCTPDEADTGEDDGFGDSTFPCKNKSQAGANMRFRLNPELHISDNLRVLAQIDMLDNLVLGSTPEGYANQPGVNGGYETIPRSGYTPLGAFDTTQVPPRSGINSYRDSILVKRAWAEYSTPVGQLRFGRMPSHWGLGILANSGDGFDDDAGTTADRIMFVTGIKALDLYIAGLWDFTNEGPHSELVQQPQEQPYDLGQLDDVDQYILVIARRQNAELTKIALAKGQLVVNGGAYIVYRKQLLASDAPGGCGFLGGAALGCPPDQLATGFNRRGAEALIPDLWFQLLYKKFRFELEAVTVQGSIESIAFTTPGTVDRPDNDENWKIRQYGIAGEIEQKLVEDRLKLMFMSGWASGDPDVNTPEGSRGLSPSPTALQPQVGDDDTISTFRFHPTYRVDLILNRNILRRIQGVYYFRPSVDYDFMRNPNGQRFGGGFAGVWTRASRFIQTPGHEHDLGIELDLSLYFQSKDGSLNDDPTKMGGFFTMLQYGVLFPLSGLGYQQAEAERLEQVEVGRGASDISTAQVLRWYLGVFF